MSRFLAAFLAASIPLSLTACLDVEDAGGDESTLDQAATGENGLQGAPEHLFKGRDAKSARPGGTSSPLMAGRSSRSMKRH